MCALLLSQYFDTKSYLLPNFVRFAEHCMNRMFEKPHWK